MMWRSSRRLAAGGWRLGLTRLTLGRSSRRLAAGGWQLGLTLLALARKSHPPAASRQPLLAARALTIVTVCALLGACRQDMHNQPKYRGLRASAFFADGSSARPLVEGTVARGTLQEDEAFFTGKIDKATVKEFPFPIDAKVVDRGQERFNIYCSPCHDRTGGGNGMVVQRGYKQPPSFHLDRLRQADVGYFFDVITNGFGAMPDYRAQIAPRDRWAIVAYVRALQYSQHAPATDVPGGDPTKVPQQPAGGGHEPGKH